MSLGEFFGFGNRNKMSVNFGKQIDPYYQRGLDYLGQQQQQWENLYGQLPNMMQTAGGYFDRSGIQGLMSLAGQDMSADIINQGRANIRQDVAGMLQGQMANIGGNVPLGIANAMRRQAFSDAYSNVGRNVGNLTVSAKQQELARRQQAYSTAGGLQNQIGSSLAGLYGALQEGLMNMQNNLTAQTGSTYLDRAQSAGNIAGANAANYANTMAGRQAFWGNLIGGAATLAGGGFPGFNILKEIGRGSGSTIPNSFNTNRWFPVNTNIP